MDKFAFACAVTSGATVDEALILGKSIRTFAGEYSNCPFWVFVPAALDGLRQGVEDELSALPGQAFPFETGPASRLPFGKKVFAAAAAEKLALGKTDLLVWMDSDSLVFNSPVELLLDPGKDLGCRPVDLQNIGSPYEKPMDSFWQEIYRDCNVSEDKLFPIETVVDEKPLWPYINAGLLVVRPEKKLLQLWSERLDEFYSSGHFEDYLLDSEHKIFFHQAALAGAILSSLDREQIKIYSHLVSYPLHLHSDYPVERKPQFMNDLFSCRYLQTPENAIWQEQIQVKEPLKSWLSEQFGTP